MFKQYRINRLQQEIAGLQAEVDVINKVILKYDLTIGYIRRSQEKINHLAALKEKLRQLESTNGNV